MHNLVAPALRLFYPLLALVAIAGLTGCGSIQASSELSPRGEPALFVAPWGSDTAPGTFDEPLFSLGRAAQLAQPGDTILLRGGVYDAMGEHVYLHIDLSGTADAPITIKSYPGERAIFDGHLHPWHPRYAGDGHEIMDPYLVWIRGDHLLLEDITLRNGVGRGFALFGHHNVVRRIVSHHHHAAGIYLIGSYNLLEYVTAHDNNSVANGGNSADGISMFDGVGTRSGLETRGNVIRYALTYRNSDDGIDLWNSWDTLIEHSISFENGIGPTGNGVGFKLGGGDRRDTGTIARFNIAFANKANFVSNGSTGVLMYNNTAWASPVNYVLTLHRTNACDNQAYNNISYQPGSYHVIRGDCSIDDNNSWNLNIDDPLFNSLAPTTPDFLSLSTHSPAINAGIDMGYPSAPDLGARQTNTHHPNLPVRAP